MEENVTLLQVKRIIVTGKKKISDLLKSFPNAFTRIDSQLIELNEGWELEGLENLIGRINIKIGENVYKHLFWHMNKSDRKKAYIEGFDILMINRIVSDSRSFVTFTEGIDEDYLSHPFGLLSPDIYKYDFHICYKFKGRLTFTTVKGGSHYNNLNFLP